MLYRNFPLKAVSLLLAIFLWVWVLLTEQNPIVEQTFSKIKVVPEGIQPNLTIAGELPTVDVRVKGLKQDLQDLRETIQAFVSCRNLKAGSYHLEVQIRAPSDLTVVGKQPSELSVVIEDIVSENRTAEAKLVGEPPVGYELLGALISPKIIQVSGSRTQVDRASRVMVTVDLQRIIPGVAISMPARAVDSNGSVVQGITLTPPRVNIVADLKPIVASKVLPVFIRTKGMLPDRISLVSLKVDPPMVTAVLPASNITEVTRVETKEVDLGNARTSFTRKVGLIVPEGVSLLSDSEVTVSIRLAPTPNQPPDADDHQASPPD